MAATGPPPRRIRRASPPLRRPAGAPLLAAALLAAPALGCGSEGPEQPFDPFATGASPGVVGIAAGTGSWCAVTESAAFCWGENDHGQLGDGTRTARGLPAEVAGDVEFELVGASSWTHRCGLSAEGEAFCWGDNEDGQLGDGGTEPSLEPTAAAGALRFTGIGAGRRFSCGLAADGTAHCWGDNREGQQGTGEPGRVEPTPMAGDHRFTSLSVGDAYACGVDERGDAHCVGDNAFGQLGDGTSVSASDEEELPAGHTREPRKVVGDLRFERIAARFAHTCGVTVEARLHCWGSHADAQLGPIAPDELDECEADAGGTVPCALQPVRVPLPSSVEVEGVSVGAASTCVLTAGGRAACWGRGFPNPDEVVLASHEDEEIVEIRTVGRGGGACAVTASGRVFCGAPVARVSRPWSEVPFPG